MNETISNQCLVIGITIDNVVLFISLNLYIIQIFIGLSTTFAFFCFCFLFGWLVGFFETGFLCIVLAVLELTL